MFQDGNTIPIIKLHAVMMFMMLINTAQAIKQALIVYTLSRWLFRVHIHVGEEFSFDHITFIINYLTLRML